MRTTSPKTSLRINPKKEVMTREKLIPLFENIKELIVSTAKGTEAVLTREMRKEVGGLREEIHVTQQALKATKDELNSKIDDTKKELRAEIAGAKEELRSEIKATEARLTNKIDLVRVRHDDHETRISTLESTHS